MFNRLLDTKVKKQLLNAFFSFPARSFHPNELKEMVVSSKQKLAQALRDLEQEGIIVSFIYKRKKYYRIDRHLKWYDEIRNLVEDEQIGDDPASRRLKSFKNAKLIVLTGIFAGQPQVETDVLFVSDKLTASSLSQALSDLKKMTNQEINYTIMNREEFDYRQHMRDRFIRDILDNPHVEVVNELRKRKKK